MTDALINHRYRLEAELGRGGTGIVYRAFDTLLDRQVAVKVLSPANLSPENRARLLNEARAAARLNHPNIVSVFDAGEEETSAYIVMELLEGRSLYGLKPASLAEVFPIARQVCLALEHAHANGVIHRDLKPENVILTRDGAVKLTDFGLARSLSSRVTLEGGISGTVYYLSPEQALGRPVDARTDLYALGVMLYELAAGQLPFLADDPLAIISQHLYAPVVPPSTHNPNIPPGMEALVLGLMSKAPEDRPAGAGEVRRALEELAGEGGLAATAPAMADVSPLHRLAYGRLIGREQEFAFIKETWSQAVGGGGGVHVLAISGEPGVGKTPLLLELRALVEVSGGYALAGECYAEGNLPYAPAAEIVRSALQQNVVELPELALADLATLAPDLRTRYPDLPVSPLLDPAAEQQRLFESFVALCFALARRAPLLLAVEDVQWADGGTLFLVSHLARRARSARMPILVVLTYREEELTGACCLPDVLLELHRDRLAARLKLSRLDREKTRRVLAAMFQQEVAPEFLESIYRETEGNLFFIEELCKALIEGGQVYRTNSHWHMPGIESVQLPQSIRATIEARVAKLPEKAQEILLLAAVIGREFDFETLQLASGEDENSLVDALELAERAQLVEEARGRGRESFIFAHGLIPACLKESVSGLRRRRLHRRVAAAIQALKPEDHPALARHFLEAGDEPQACKHFAEAGRQAAAVFANQDAAYAFTQALELTPEGEAERFELLVWRARVYDVMARRPQQLADIQAMLAIAEARGDDGQRFESLIALADYFLATEHMHSRQPAEKALAIARAMNDPVSEAQALRRLGYEARFRRELSQSREMLEAAAERFRSAGMPREAAICLHELTLALIDQGQLSRALETVEEAIRLSQQAGDRRQEAIGRRRIAIVLLDEGRFAEALPHVEQALALHRQLGDRAEESHALNVRGTIYSWLGRKDEAESDLRESLAIGREIGSSISIMNAAENLAENFQRFRGEPEAGLDFLEEQLQRLRESGDELILASLTSKQALFLSLLGQYRAALEQLEEIRPKAETLFGTAVVSAQLGAFAGRLLAELGQFEQARRELRAALEPMQDAQRSIDLAVVYLESAYACLEMGTKADLRQGMEHARQAVSIVSATERKMELAEALVCQARLHLALGEAEEALVCTSRALQASQAFPFSKELYEFTHSQALRAVGREAEAFQLLQRVHERLMEIAGRIHNPDYRRSFLENVRVNREIVQAWEEHSAGAARARPAAGSR